MNYEITKGVGSLLSKNAVEGGFNDSESRKPSKTPGTLRSGQGVDLKAGVR